MDQLIFYVDWSGTPHDHFTNYSLTAVVVPDNHLTSITTQFQIQLSKLRRSYSLDLNTKFTASDLFRGRGGFEQLHIDDRFDIAAQLINFIVSKDLQLLTVFFDKSHVSYSGNNHRYDFSNWVRNWTWGLLLERVSQYTKERNKVARLVVQQMNPQEDHRLQELYSSSLAFPYVAPRLLAGISYEPKSGTSLLQLTDLLSWILHRYYTGFLVENDFDLLSLELFDRVSHLFAKDRWGKVEGFGIKLFPDLEAPAPVERIYPLEFNWHLVETLQQVADQLRGDDHEKVLNQINKIREKSSEQEYIFF